MNSTDDPSRAGGPAPPPGLTKPFAESGNLPGFAYGSAYNQRKPGFTYRREGQCFVLTPARHTVSHVLGVVMAVSLAVGFCGMIAYLGAFLIRDFWPAWHGIDVPGQDINGRPPSQAGTLPLVMFTALGAGLLLLGLYGAAAAVWATVVDLCLGNRPSVLDRGRGEFRVGGRVVCGLGDIARLHLRRGHEPDAPEDLRRAFYYGSFVLRDGRQVPLIPSFRVYSRMYPETTLGNGVAGARIEAVMAAGAAFAGIEYTLTGGPDNRLRDIE